MQMLTPSKIDVPPRWWDKVFAPSSHVAVITTVDAEGRVNAGAYGTCTRVCHDPVFVAFTCNIGTDTHQNVLGGQEFVVNLRSFRPKQLGIVLAAGTRLPPGENELAAVGAEVLPSTVVAPPRVAPFGRHFECRVEWTKEWANRMMVVGRVVAVSCDPSFIDAAGDLVWDTALPVHFCGAPYPGSFVGAYEVMTLPSYSPPARS